MDKPLLLYSGTWSLAIHEFMPEKHPEHKSSKVEAGKVRVFVTYKESGIKLDGETYFPQIGNISAQWLRHFCLKNWA
jgi:hypothetical protein